MARRRGGRRGAESRRAGPRSNDGADDVPVQAFADIAFLLIIFFILATSLTQLAGIETDMPSGKKAEARAEKTTIVNIHNGVITINDKSVDAAELRKRLGALDLEARKGEDKIVMLEATGKVPYQQYYEVITAISASGGVIAIVQEEEGPR